MRLQHHGMITGLQLIHNALKLVISALTAQNIFMLEVVVKAAFVMLLIMIHQHIVNQVLGVNLQQQPLLKYHVLHQAKSAGMDQMVG